MIWRGLSEDALAVLNFQLPSNLADSDLQIKKLSLESLAYGALGDMSKSAAKLQEAEQITTVSNSELIDEVRIARGIFEVRTGKPGDAERSFRESLQFASSRNRKFPEASALLNLSFAATHQRHFDEAIDWANRAAQVAQSFHSGLIEEKALGNLGWSFYMMGDFDRSLDLSLGAEKRSRELGIIKDQARWVYNSGVVYYQQEQFAQAEDNFKKSLDLAERLGDPEQTANALSSLAFLSVREQKFQAAKDYSRRTFDLARARGDRMRELYALFTLAQVAVATREEKQAERILLEIIRSPETEAPLRWQAQAELAHSYERALQVAAARTEYENSLSTVECARGSLHREEFRLPFLANAAPIYDDYIHFLVEQGKTDGALQAADYSRAQTLSEGLGLLKKEKDCAVRPEFSINPRQAARVAGGAVLFYWLGERQSYLWVVTAKKTSLIKLPPAAEINSLVQGYRQALLESRDALETGNPVGSRLYEILVAPAQKYISANSRVTIIADGSLNNLNFETLIVPGPRPHYWIEDVNLSNASSMRMLASSNTAQRSKGKQQLLLVGDPVVPDPKFPPLPSAKIEMQDIEKHFPPKNTEVLSGNEANPAAFFKSKPESFSYLHFVAHGTASQLSPLDSAVILSKATAEEDSYKLHARDIIGHPLHANLVVISTCYGSGSALYNGEGLVGLSWAFLRAGAHNVIGALWAVSDASTPQLMDELYAGISQGHNPQDALRDAKLSLLRSDGPFRKPIYWAPFQLYTGP